MSCLNALTWRSQNNLLVFHSSCYQSNHLKCGGVFRLGYRVKTKQANLLADNCFFNAEHTVKEL